MTTILKTAILALMLSSCSNMNPTQIEHLKYLEGIAIDILKDQLK